MNIFEKYRLPYKGGNPSDLKNLKTVATMKHLENHHAIEGKYRACSSISLPVWNALRLAHIHKKLNSNGIHVSKTEIILSAIKLYSPAMKNQQIDFDRLRRKNKTSCRYVKVSTYSSLHDWNYFQVYSLHVKVCFSHAVDIALRLYLRVVERRLLSIFFRSVKISAGKYINLLESLTSPGKYQKNIVNHSQNSLKLNFELTRTRILRI
ncbi:MAG: hypothetical protein KDK41_05055 [Leptospiraceae bacterium]|nr:hypothetical protein [Leptospiraceae bacterium]